MSDLTGAQKARLGFFILLAAGLFGLVLVVKLGQTLFDHRDIYHVRMPGSVGSLDPGAAVTFNGIVVGRVESVGVDPDDVAFVAIDLSLTRDTVIPADTQATVSMRGITGMKYVELNGGTNAARRRAPGEEIPAGRSMLDDLQERGISIATKLEGLLDDARALMQGPIVTRIEGTLASVQRATELVEDTLATAAPRVAGLLEHADEVAAALTNVLLEARTATRSVSDAAGAGRDALRTIDAVTARVGASVDGLVTRIDPVVVQVASTITRAGIDLRRALDEAADDFDSIGVLVTMLRGDPSALVLGRRAKERDLP